MSSNVTKLPTLRTIADQQTMLAAGMAVLVERQNAILEQMTLLMKHMGELAERQAVIAAAMLSATPKG
jgi:hypothetical protein